MTTQTVESDFKSFNHLVGHGLSLIGDQLRTALPALGPHGRRIALTGVGAALSLSLGAATASALRLPADITHPAEAEAQVMAQSELPSETAARTYALENPPVSVSAPNADADVTAINAEPTVGSDPALSVAYPFNENARQPSANDQAVSTSPTTETSSLNNASATHEAQGSS